MEIRPFALDDIASVRAFADRAIGSNYYTEAELTDIYHRSKKNGQQCSLVLEDKGKIRGLRFTYPPGSWHHGKGQGLSPEKWGVPFEDVAYFQSVFVDPELTGQGWGPRMSQAAIEILKTLKTRAIVAHSWKESPNDSSRRYLESLGFVVVSSHPMYWHGVDYTCTRCGKPCVCTAEEMILRWD